MNNWAEKLAKRPPLLLEVNLAGEASTFGCAPAELLRALAEINRGNQAAAADWLDKARGLDPNCVLLKRFEKRLLQ